MNQKIPVCIFIMLLLISAVASICVFRTTASAGDNHEINVNLAADYFREAADLSRNNGGRLWGTSLYGPMLFVDSDSRTVVANHADSEFKLHVQGEVFIGKLPDDVNIANTATQWAGVRWTMIIWPLPEDRRERLRLMAHELFHRIQDQIGLQSRETSNRHLDSRGGRTWLRLEWRALERALEENAAARREAVANAIYFRRYRQSMVPESLAQECALETNEGLAEYTGVKLSSRSEAEARTRAAYSLNQAQNKQSFVRSFAYASGPAYGLLLDAALPGWRRELKSEGDMSALLQRAVGLKLPPLAAEQAAARAKLYDGDEVIASETRREAIRSASVAKYRAKLIDGPVLVIPAAGSFNYSFNPNNLVPLDETGTVFPTIRVTDDWGILEVTDGVLMIRSNGVIKELHVTAPNASTARSIQGPGWKLELNDGWTITTGKRSGDYTLSKQH